MIESALALTLAFFPLHPGGSNQQQPIERGGEAPIGGLLLSGGAIGLAIAIGACAMKQEETPEAEERCRERAKAYLPLRLPERLAKYEAIGGGEDLEEPEENLKPSPAEPEQQKPPSLDVVYHAGMLTLLGGKGSGKTTAMAAICRYRIQAGHTIKVFDHHYHYDAYKPFRIHSIGAREPILEHMVYGVGLGIEEQFQSIAEGLEQVLEECSHRYLLRQQKPESEWGFQNHPITIVTEELGDYKGAISPDLWQRFMMCVATQFRKANFFWIGITHNDTLDFFGGAKSVSKILKQETVSLVLLNQADSKAIGGLKPKGLGNLTVPGEKAALVNTRQFKKETPQADSLDFSDLVKPGLEANEVQMANSSELSPHLKAIWELAKRLNRIIKARDVQSAHLPEVEERKFSADAIRYCFEQLAQMGWGELKDEGDRLGFLADKPGAEDC